MSDELIVNVIGPILGGLLGIGLGMLSLWAKYAWQDRKERNK